MGIYIPGMEMPTEKYGKMTITLYPNGNVAEYVGDIGRVWNAVPVPEHGRLVDADAFSEEMKNRQDAAWEWRCNAKDEMTAARADAVLSFLSEVKLTLDKLPTVIPKEEP